MNCGIYSYNVLTKKEFFLSFVHRKVCPWRFDKFAYVPSVGTSGGLVIRWNSLVFACNVIYRETYAVSVQFCSLHVNRSWTLTNVYGPSSGDDQQRFVDWFKNVEIS
jgi:hypothetical protein